MLTTPITTSHFHSRVLSLLSSHLSTMKTATSDYSGTMSTTQNTRPLVIPQLSPADTHLTPNEAMSQLVGLTSPWIDLCSPDPLIADLSRQILMLEVAYAAFCGIGYLLIPGPKLHHGDMHSEGLIYYARAIQDAIHMGPYIQFHIWLRSMDQPDMDLDEIGDLGPLTRKEFLQASDIGPWPQTDPFGTWDAWDLIRRNCKYHPRLCVGKNILRFAGVFLFMSCCAKNWCSTFIAEAASANICPVSMAFGTGAFAHHPLCGVHQESKRISGSVKSAPGIDIPVLAPSEPSLASPL